MEAKLFQLFWTNICHHSIKLKRYISYDLEILLLDVYPWKVTANVNQQVQTASSKWHYLLKQETENNLNVVNARMDKHKRIHTELLPYVKCKTTVLFRDVVNYIVM